ncbi:lysophospholipid acyltransferase family protein [Stieleria sp. TO1_6]|uniref:lysophospholipid acyltransferase family protein n=1 Tax=Stieleria tagensis TaxID=2956795 RepID=UPI00209BB929|nr:lysophospholipid acyltransferase family protein [Stieleria tagensis]MCO8120960.1 lysophospholipid acyltransferase family protein [Stieleria tagensis]
MNTADDPVPPPATWFLNGFHRFLRPYLGRHFHTVAIERASRLDPPIPEQTPVIVYANHPSWWDPLIAHYLHRQLFSPRHFFAPIDAEALQQYRVFEKLGFYGVQLSSQSGAAAFLKTSLSILDQPNSAIWITPEGRFVDSRDLSATLMPGLAHLCHRSQNVVAVPIALEYTFWDERLPVCLASLGTPIAASEHSQWDKPQWATELTAGLRSAQSQLSRLAIERSSEPFDNLLRGSTGSGWFYDSCRRIKSFATGGAFKANHGDQFQ